MLENGGIFITKWVEGGRGTYYGFGDNCKLVKGNIMKTIKKEANFLQLLIKTDKQEEFTNKIMNFFQNKIYTIEFDDQLANLRTQDQINVYDVVNDTIRGLSVFVYLKEEGQLKYLEMFLSYNKKFFCIYDLNFNSSILQRYFEKQKRKDLNFLKYGIVRENTFIGSEQLPKHKICSFDIEVVSPDNNNVPNGAADGNMVVAVSFVIGTINPESNSLTLDRELVYLLWLHEKPPTLKNDPLRTYLFFFNEVDLLKAVCNFLSRELDVPFLIGYNILNFDFPVILNRMIVLGLAQNFYTINEINRMMTGLKQPIPCCERFQIVDLMVYLKKMHRDEYSSFSLNNISIQELKKKKLDISFQDMNFFYLQKSQDSAFIQKLCDYVVLDSILTLEIYFVKKVYSNLFPLINVCFANTIDYTSNAASKIITSFLSVMFPAQGLCSFQTKTKETNEEEENITNTGDMFKSIKQYKGATVMKTIRTVIANQTLYVVDFSSLYPSIIIEYNICKNYVIENFDPLLYPKEVTEEFLKRTHKMERYYTIKRAYSKSPLSVVIEYLIKQRKKSNNPYLNYAYKLISNSIYGLLASQGQMRDLNSAALVTAYGRLMHRLMTTYIETNLNLKVCYGDSDSFFIISNGKEIDIADVLNKYIRECLKLQNISLTLDFESETTIFLAEKKTYLMKLKDGKIKIAGLTKRINLNFKEYFYNFIELLLNLIHEHFHDKNVFETNFKTLIQNFFLNVLEKTPKEHYMFVLRVKPYYEYKNLSCFHSICSFRRNLLGINAEYATAGELLLYYVLPVTNTEYLKRKKSDCVEFYDRIVEMALPIDKLEYLKKVFSFIPILERHVLKTDNSFLNFIEKLRKEEIKKYYYPTTVNKNIWQKKCIVPHCKITFYYDDIFKELADYNIHHWDLKQTKHFQTVICVGNSGTLTHTTGEVFNMNVFKQFFKRHKEVKSLDLLLLPTSNFIVNSNDNLIWFLNILYTRPETFNPHSNFHFTPDNRLIVVENENKINIFTA